MAEEKKLKVIIFENGQTLSNRFKGLFEFNGHAVLSYSDPKACPLFRDTQCNCQQDTPCADVLIADIKLGDMTGLEFFESQRRRGCKAAGRNKLLLGDDLTLEQQDAINKLGCGFIKKPFDEYEVAEWIVFNARAEYGVSPTLH